MSEDPDKVENFEPSDSWEIITFEDIVSLASVVDIFTPLSHEILAF